MQARYKYHASVHITSLMLMRYLLTFLRWTFYLLLVILGVLLVIYASLRYDSRDDDPLDPQAVAMLTTYPAQIPVERNGYFAWIGIMAPESASPAAWGREWQAQAMAADAANSSGLAKPSARSRRQRLSEEPSSGVGLCEVVETCLQEVAADPERARALLGKAQTLLQRADAAMAYPEYQEPVRPDFGLASEFSVQPVSWRAISGIRFALDVAAGRHAEALQRMSRDIAFHTAQAAGAETLADKLAAFNNLRNNYLLLAYYSRANPALARTHHKQIKAMLAPLPEAATSMQAPLRTETQALTRLLAHLRDVGLWSMADQETQAKNGGLLRLADALLMPLYLPNATLNDVTFLRMAIMDAEQVVDDHSYLLALSNAYSTVLRYQASSSDCTERRNLVGRAVANAVLTADWRSHLFQRDDLLALRAALALRQDMRAEGEAMSPGGEARLAAALRHRFSGQSPQWDAARHAMVYEANPLREDAADLSIPM